VAFKNKGAFKLTVTEIKRKFVTLTLVDNNRYLILDGANRYLDLAIKLFKNYLCIKYPFYEAQNVSQIIIRFSMHYTVIQTGMK